MGATASELQNGNGCPLVSTHAKTAQIKEFHTKDQWEAYFDSCKEINKLLVIDFSATWCGPCKFIEPTIKEFAATYTEVEFMKIDVDVLADVAREFQVNVMPTFILIKNGKEVERIVGTKSDELQNKIEKHMKQRVFEV
ncbi:Thioredoxin domain-containing protein [Cephalotus follicularis]|uniref:Thioredoxin domain-containing protein n=1 Tax=Cephalotus follicularis TaxID=3775 RepID=A0A1Q3CNG9_CEPFO|nr:Thioredoxin domain-containing protein [Cephalotus follicularis]